MRRSENNYNLHYLFIYLFIYLFWIKLVQYIIQIRGFSNGTSHTHTLLKWKTSTLAKALWKSTKSIQLLWSASCGKVQCLISIRWKSRYYWIPYFRGWNMLTLFKGQKMSDFSTEVFLLQARQQGTGKWFPIWPKLYTAHLSTDQRVRPASESLA